MVSNVQLTRSGVAYDFKISPHKVKVIYNRLTDEKIEFIFSSELYKNKFEEKLEENRKKINDSLSKRFGFTIKNDKLSDIKLYTTIEKRGFLINHNRESIEWLSNIILDGNHLIMKN